MASYNVDPGGPMNTSSPPFVHTVINKVMMLVAEI